MKAIENTKGSKFYSILKLKCPICQEGDLYVSQNPYHPKKFDKMHEHCPNCGFKYEQETGFFYGALYVSYALTVAVSVAIFMATYVLYPQAEYWLYIINILVGLIVLMPVTYRFSRAIWSNFFASYARKKGFN